MDATPWIWADFNNVDQHGRVRLSVAGALSDIAAQHIALYDGLRVVLSDDEVCTEGTVRVSHDEGWVAEIDWDRFVEVRTEGQ